MAALALSNYTLFSPRPSTSSKAIESTSLVTPSLCFLHNPRHRSRLCYSLLSFSPASHSSPVRRSFIPCFSAQDSVPNVRWTLLLFVALIAYSSCCYRFSNFCVLLFLCRIVILVFYVWMFCWIWVAIVWDGNVTLIMCVYCTDSLNAFLELRIPIFSVLDDLCCYGQPLVTLIRLLNFEVKEFFIF